MTTLPFVEGNASEYNLVEDYASEDYDSEDYSICNQAAPDSNLIESVYYDVLPDVLIDEYVPAHAAPTIEAENAIEQSVVVEAVEADATMESEIAVEEEEDAMSEWYEEEDEDVTSECLEETWVESEDEDMISEGSEEASEDEAWVAGEEGLTIQDFAESHAPPEEETWNAGEEGLTIQDFAESNTPFEEGTRIAGEEGLTIQEFAESNAPLEEDTWVAGEGVMIEGSAQLYTPFEVGTSVAIEESAQEASEAVTTMITIPAATSSTSLIPMWSSTVVEATGDSTVPTHDWEAFFGCSPMVMLQECRTALLTAVENFFIEVEQFRIRLRRFINSMLGKWEATKVD